MMTFTWFLSLGTFRVSDHCSAMPAGGLAIYDFYPVFRQLVGMDDAVEFVEVLLQEGRGLALVVHDIAYVHRWGVC